MKASMLFGATFLAGVAADAFGPADRVCAPAATGRVNANVADAAKAAADARRSCDMNGPLKRVDARGRRLLKQRLTEAPRCAAVDFAPGPRPPLAPGG